MRLFQLVFLFSNTDALMIYDMILKHTCPHIESVYDPLIPCSCWRFGPMFLCSSHPCTDPSRGPLNHHITAATECVCLSECISLLTGYWGCSAAGADDAEEDWQRQQHGQIRHLHRQSTQSNRDNRASPGGFHCCFPSACLCCSGDKQPRCFFLY